MTLEDSGIFRHSNGEPHKWVPAGINGRVCECGSEMYDWSTNDLEVVGRILEAAARPGLDGVDDLVTIFGTTAPPPPPRPPTAVAAPPSGPDWDGIFAFIDSLPVHDLNRLVSRLHRRLPPWAWRHGRMP